MTGPYFFSVILLICVATAAAQNCPYTFVTKTGNQAATVGSRVDLSLNSDSDDPHIIRNIGQYNFLGADYKSFQSHAVDVFIFNGTCEHYCNNALQFHGQNDNSSWAVEKIMLRASTDDECDITGIYTVNRTLHGHLDEFTFNFCNTTGAVGTEKQKLTQASLLRLFGMPSYTT